MSVEAIAWALDARRSGPMSPEHRLVLAALADYANAELEHQAWPSIPTLAARIGCHTRSIQRAVAELLRLGVIARGDQALVEHYRGDRRPTVYRLELRRGDSTVRSYGVTALSPRGDSSVANGVTAVSPKPITEPLENNPTPYPRPATSSEAANRATPEPLVCTSCGVVGEHYTSDCTAKPGPRPGPPPRGDRRSPAYLAAVDAARARRHRARRPDGSCRQCDDVHPLGTACAQPVPPPRHWRDAPPPEDAIPGDQPLPLDEPAAGGDR